MGQVAVGWLGAHRFSRGFVHALTDPSALRQAEKRAAREAAENDFASVARDWLENIKGEWAPQHYVDSLKRFEVHIFPKIGRRSIREITAPELLAALRAIEARGTIESAHKVARLRPGLPVCYRRWPLRPQSGGRSSRSVEGQAQSQTDGSAGGRELAGAAQGDRIL
jgi:hypothetical protein